MKLVVVVIFYVVGVIEVWVLYLYCYFFRVELCFGDGFVFVFVVNFLYW